MNTRRSLPVAALILALLGGSLAGQQPAPAAPEATPQPPAAPADQPQQPPVTFRAEVNYVEVDARVLDASGAFIAGLGPKDFQVLEDGKPQQVTIFSVVNLPVDPGTPAAVRLEAH